MSVGAGARQAEVTVSHKWILAAAMASVPATAFGANKDMERLQVQVAALQSTLSAIEQQNDDTLRELKRMNEALAEQNAFLRRGVQDRKLTDEAIQTTLRELDQRISEIGEQLQGMHAQNAAAPPVAPAAPAGPDAGPVAPPRAGTPAPPAPRELYSQAYADYARGNYDLAIQEYQEYLKNYPDTDLSDNAQYWIGECLYSKQQYAEALEAWDELFRRFPGSDKLPDARYKKGMALERLGRRSQAVLEYRAVATRYPNSEAGRKAREKLNPQQ